MTIKLQYGAGPHNYAYACFACRKSFKRPLVGMQRPYRLTEEQRKTFNSENYRFMIGFRHKCPDCAGPARFMGRDFKAPRATDLRTWRRVERFMASGRLFHRGTTTHDIF